MLFMAHNHVAENPFHAECLKLLRKLREAPDRQLAHSVLLKRMKIDAKTFQELINTLEQQGDIQTTTQSTDGRPQRAYRLLGDDQGGESAG
jgi:predicted ArsR family transcriptional regulator